MDIPSLPEPRIDWFDPPPLPALPSPLTEEALRAAVEAAGAPYPDLLQMALRAIATDVHADRVGVAAYLASFATHPERRVRDTIARGCHIFPDPFFDRAVEALAGETYWPIQRSLQRSLKAHALRRKESVKVARQEQVATTLLEELESKHGRAARRLAERAIRRGVEQVIARLYHELARADAALTESLRELDPRSFKTDRVKKNVDFVQAILRNGRMYATEIKPRFALHELAPLIEKARAQVFALLAERSQGIAFTATVPRGLSLHVDEAALHQALLNLLANAIEAYTPPARGPVRVDVTTRRLGSEVVIQIADEGGGMSDETKARLFVPFGSMKPGGTGVGLPVVRRMIEEIHSGEISIESTRGVGTVVTLVLPAHQEGVKKEVSR